MKNPTFGDNCEIYLDALVESGLLIQANSGGGKSWAIRRMLEQTYGKIQHIIVDVEDEFHTLREKYDYVVAGKNGDCPADIKSAAMLGRRLLELGVSTIVNIYDLGTQRKLFVKRFFDAIVASPRELWHPILIVLDEAHIFAPEKGHSESASAVIDLMTLGRKRGFRGVLATQRISKLAKDAAAECNSKLIGRAALDIDMKRAGEELGFTSREDVRSLRTLSPGEFYAFGPALSVEGVEKIKVGPVKTKHLRAGERAAPPTPPRERVKKVLAQLADLPHEAEEEARTLADAKAKIKQLEAELKKAPKAVEPKTIEMAVIKSAQLAQLGKVLTRGEKLVERIRPLVDKLAPMNVELSTMLSTTRTIYNALNPSKTSSTPPALKPAVINGGKPYAQVHDRRPTEDVTDTSELPKGEAKVLRALIQYRTVGLGREQLSVITGYKRQTRDAYILRLRSRGLVDQVGDQIVVTDDGCKAMPNAEPLPTGEALRDWHFSRLPAGEKIILEQLISRHPDAVERAWLDEVTPYKRQTRDAYLLRLRAKKLVEEAGRGLVKASNTLFD